MINRSGETNLLHSPLPPGITKRGAFVADIEDSCLATAREALSAHLLGDSVNQLTLLVAPKDPPLLGVSNDGEVKSFIASGPWAEELKENEEPNTSWCYQVLSNALTKSPMPKIDIIGASSASEPIRSARAIDVIIPHRGSSDHLAVCIAAILEQTVPCNIALGLDQACDDDHRSILTSNNRISACSARDAPKGPYVIRQYLADKSKADFIAFQDSDDLSLPTRLKELTDAAILFDSDIVGCHELRLDEINRAIFAIRFPIDVSAALEVTASHPQFFPTTVVRRDYFARVGGFSTDLHFGADTEYLLRSHFTAKIRNIDRFLYIRRKRSGSLTTTPETALGSPARVDLDRRWKTDFEAIKKGELKLDSSSLALRRSISDHSFDRL